MTAPRNTVPAVPRRLKARRAGLRLVAKGHLAPESLHHRPVSASAFVALASSGMDPHVGGDQSHAWWLDLERADDESAAGTCGDARSLRVASPSATPGREPAV